MRRLRIALLVAAHDDADPRRNFRREVNADLVEFHATDGELPETFDYDACIITGSRDSVYWDEPWIEALKEWVSEAVETDMPFLGVCFGHQLLADVLGGTVEDMGEYEIGYREIEHDGSSRLFDGIDREFTVFTAHSDRVSTLPDGAEKIAGNGYGIHGFRQQNVFGVQFHPEYDIATARFAAVEKADLSEKQLDSVLTDITAENYAAACEAKTLFENFTQFVRENQTESRQTNHGVADD